jgi:excisionase family DNA binding protein
MDRVDKLLSTREVRERLNVGEKVLARWIRSGRLKAVRLGVRELRVSEHALAAFIKESTRLRPPGRPPKPKEATR